MKEFMQNKTKKKQLQSPKIKAHEVFKNNHKKKYKLLTALSSDSKLPDFNVDPMDFHYHPLKLLFQFYRIMNPIMAQDGYRNINALINRLQKAGYSG